MEHISKSLDRVMNNVTANKTTEVEIDETPLGKAVRLARGDDVDVVSCIKARNQAYLEAAADVNKEQEKDDSCERS